MRRDSAAPRTLRELSAPDRYGVIRGYVHLSQISGVDPHYQRTTEPSHVNNLVSHWNQVLCDPVLLARRTDDSLWVIKGGHRVRAIEQRGDSWVFCTVVDVAELKDEAEMFYVDATGIRLLKRMDKYRANTVREEPSTVAMNATVEACGFHISASSGPTSIVAVGAIERVWSLGGDQLLRDVLNIVGGVWADHESAREGEKITALGVFLRSVRADPNYQPMRLMQLLAEYGPDRVTSMALNLASERDRGVQGNGRPVVIAIQLRELYNHKWPRRKLAPLTMTSGKRLIGQR